MAEIAFLGEKENSVERVFALGRKERVSVFGECVPEVIGRHNLVKWKERLAGVKYVFSTWGMPDFTRNEYQTYFPSLQCIFYAAGTVKKFAENAFNSGIRIFSSRMSNAIPVAETVFAQIVLANKGFYRSAMRMPYKTKKKIFENYGGNYEATVGIIGVGTIGALLAQRLKSLSVKVVAWDKFLSDSRAEELSLKKISLEELFSVSDVISNHLADKPETEGILDYALFTKMKKYATFINSGRGRQVSEKGLLRALKEERGRTAILDVTFPEPPKDRGALARAKNVRNGQSTENEIFKDDLATMA